MCVCDVELFILLYNYLYLLINLFVAWDLYLSVCSLRSTFQPEAQGELDSLHKFASSRGFDDDLQMWDVNYWARKQAEVLYQ